MFILKIPESSADVLNDETNLNQMKLEVEMTNTAFEIVHFHCLALSLKNRCIKISLCSVKYIHCKLQK